MLAALLVKLVVLSMLPRLRVSLAILSRWSPLSPSVFFSSRRRHTRCSRDWSSDVCSSDLTIADVAVLYPQRTVAFYSRPESKRPRYRCGPIDYLQGLYYALLEGRFFFD